MLLMTSLHFQLIAYAVVQLAFVFLDLFELWRTNGTPRVFRYLFQQRALLAFLAVSWLVYFALQNLLLFALPAPEVTLAGLCNFSH